MERAILDRLGLLICCGIAALAGFGYRAARSGNAAPHCSSNVAPMRSPPC